MTASQIIAALIGALSICTALCAAPVAVDPDRFFHSDVKPLLNTRCISCHGPDKAEGGLRLDYRERVLKGGDSGPALVPGKPEKSLLLMAIKRTHKILEMPPKEKLSGRDIDVIERWIREGAPWPNKDNANVKAHAPKGEHIGDAWSDPRNPIVQLFRGERLQLWSLKPVHCPDVPKFDQADWAKSDLDRFVLAR